REHFNRPLNEVAKKYGMCTTALKKLCRRYGVMQWPHRRLRSLEKKIASLK
ncbi:RWP-RK domain-containing protein, partial [Baffinella frigidus]